MRVGDQGNASRVVMPFDKNLDVAVRSRHQDSFVS
jgi:hypothetical protein